MSDHRRPHLYLARNNRWSIAQRARREREALKTQHISTTTPNRRSIAQRARRQREALRRQGNFAFSANMCTPERHQVQCSSTTPAAAFSACSLAQHACRQRERQHRQQGM
ncbi:hypothetical protein VKT23_007807 [Stygiomarasmius scandens]|uniref:Uncharacterized protein n=1 Tax=Marasmiellus scandens TaxID=2682957 RepID=A0ABR1JLR3_9AGAR